MKRFAPSRMLLHALAGLLVAYISPPASMAYDAFRPCDFNFGVEYMSPGLATTYSGMGVTWVKGSVEGYNWKDVEPRPPEKGKHTYNWSWIDRMILEYQRAGFKNFHIYTEARSTWATSKPKALGDPPSVLPKPEYLPYYADYIRNMVERYDGDGKDDMPGLRYPIRYWEIEAEWDTFWQGTAQEYLRLLRIARDAAKEADPQAKIILVGFLMMQWFDGNPTQQELDQRLYALRPNQKAKINKILHDMSELLKHPDLFDIVEFHSLSDWTEIIGTVNYLRREMKKNGYEKPIWAGDVNYSLNPMMFWGSPVYPYVKEQKGAILDCLSAMKKQGHKRHSHTLTWFRAEQARFTAKKILSGIGEGLAGMNIGNMEDWPQFKIVTRFTGTAPFCGLIDVKGLSDTPYTKNSVPYIMWQPRIPGEPRPVYWTIKMLAERLAPYTNVTRVEMGKGIYAYRFSSPKGVSDAGPTVSALWYDDGRGQLPGDPEPHVDITMPVRAEKVTLVPMITERGQRTPVERTLPISQGSISFKLTESPVLVLEHHQ